MLAACGPGKKAAVNEMVEPIYIGTGNEPFWNLRIEPDQIIFSRLGEEKEVYPYLKPVLSENMISYVTVGEAGRIRITFLNRPCQDNMSGESFPYHVTVEKGEQV